MRCDVTQRIAFVHRIAKKQTLDIVVHPVWSAAAKLVAGARFCSLAV